MLTAGRDERMVREGKAAPSHISETPKVEVEKNKQEEIEEYFKILKSKNYFRK